MSLNSPAVAGARLACSSAKVRKKCESAKKKAEIFGSYETIMNISNSPTAFENQNF